MTKKPEFSRKDVEILSSDTVYSGFFTVRKICLRHRLFRGGWSHPIERELFVRGDAVAAILYDPTNDLVGLIQQFRIGALGSTVTDALSDHSPWLLEVVAGMHNPGKTAEQVISQELQEEAGVQPQRLEYICEYYSSPGGTNEKLTLFCALARLEKAGGVHGLADENEDIKVVTYQADDLFERLYDGIGNATTLISLQWLQVNRQRLQDQPYETTQS
jgi:ADP-ribose pyrophosphatase